MTSIITGTLHEDLSAFMIIPHSVLLRLRDVSKVVEKIRTYFMFNNFFLPQKSHPL
jgi:hypothetical protein